MAVTRKVALVLGGALGLALLAGCGKSGAPASSGGTPAPRTVTIKALDSLRFDPASISVSVGETIRFVVTNPGKVEHEFVLGDETVQSAEEQRMRENMNMANGMPSGALAAFTIAPGETKEATVTFDRAGKRLYGCHMPGHYAAGMVGTVTTN